MKSTLIDCQDPLTAWLPDRKNRISDKELKSLADLKERDWSDDHEKFLSHYPQGKRVLLPKREEHHHLFFPNQGSKGIKTKACDITCCNCLFADFDKGTLLEQLTTLRDCQLPWPSIIVWTGNKGFHAYWLFTDPIAPNEGKVLQEQILSTVFAGTADPAVKDLPRKMRLPGFPHPKSGKMALWTGDGEKFTIADLPIPEVPTDRKMGKEEGLTRFRLALLPYGDLSIEGEGKYAAAARLCQQMGAAAKTGGWAVPMEGMRNILSEQKLEGKRLDDALRASKYCDHLNGGGLVVETKNHLSSNGLQNQETGKDPSYEYKIIKSKAVDIIKSGFKSPFQQRKELQSWCLHNLKKRLQTNDQHEYMNEGLAELQDSPEHGPGETHRIKDIQKLCDKLLVNGTNLLVGTSGVGKSRFACAFAAAWRRGDPTFAGRDITSTVPIKDRAMLIIGPDQDASAWAEILAPLGLVTKEQNEDGYFDATYAERVWLTHSGGSLSKHCMRIAQWTSEHPGGLVIADSLSALAGEQDQNDAGIGHVIYQLKAALNGSPCIIIHHANKKAAMEGATGRALVRGSDAIVASIDRLTTLSKKLDWKRGNSTEDKSPERILHSEKRGGDPLHIIVHASDWHDCTPTEAEQARLRQEKVLDGLTDQQTEIYDLIKDAGRGGISRADIGATTKRQSGPLSKQLKRLKALKLIDEGKEKGVFVTRGGVMEGVEVVEDVSPSLVSHFKGG